MVFAMSITFCSSSYLPCTRELLSDISKPKEGKCLEEHKTAIRTWENIFKTHMCKLSNNIMDLRKDAIIFYTMAKPELIEDSIEHKVED